MLVLLMYNSPVFEKNIKLIKTEDFKMSRKEEAVSEEKTLLRIWKTKKHKMLSSGSTATRLSGCYRVQHTYIYKLKPKIFSPLML